MPAWVESGFLEYVKRLPPECALQLVAIEPGYRGKGASVERAIAEEGQRMLKAIPRAARVVALDASGTHLSTETLAEQLASWLSDGRDLAWLIGGPDGLAAPCLSRAEWRWSLSRLTFPHPLVRVIVAEQLYRAWTIVQGHPYHRGAGDCPR